MSEVVGLDGKPVTAESETLEPIPELVDTLEEMLQQAKEGKIRNIAYLAAYGDHEFAQGLLGNFDESNPFIGSTLLEIQRNAYMDRYVYGFTTEEDLE